jgi:alkaline phosphatase
MSSSNRSSLRDVILRRLTRRGLLRASGTGVASAVIVGLGGEASAAAASLNTEVIAASATTMRADLRSADPHATTGNLFAAPLMQDAAPVVRIYPIDRAKLLAGSLFDLRVEALNVDPASATITIDVKGPNGPAQLLQGAPERSSPTGDILAVTYPKLRYDVPGTYTITARVTSGGQSAQMDVTNTVLVGASSGKKAKNVIFFLGDGMGSAPITAARILSKGITEGRYSGMLEMDRMEYRGMVTTSGYDSIATDSANSMSAYMCGHKSSVNAMGVYVASDPDPARHPRVETITELLKRTRGMSVGIVTTAEVQDATPAAVFAHTRRRSEYQDIMDQALKSSQQPDVILGGGSASLLPQSVPGSRRKDERDLVKEFQAQGFAWVASRAQLKSVMSGVAPDKLLGLFHLGHMNFYMDREFQKNPNAPNPSQSIIAPQFNDQPTLTEMTTAALQVLEKNLNGFFLMVEAASIDKAEHPLDWQRAVYDTIEFDQALGAAKRWAANRDDTLIVVTADHNHAMSIAGTNDANRGVGRQANGVYAEAGFPNYVDTNGDGFPDNPDPSRTLFVTFSNHPDFHDDFRFKQAGYIEPALIDRNAPNGPTAVANPERDSPAELQLGNLDYAQTNCVHTVEDVPLGASGPGAARFNGVLDNTDVFFAMMDALALDARKSVTA